MSVRPTPVRAATSFPGRVGLLTLVTALLMLLAACAPQEQEAPEAADDAPDGAEEDGLEDDMAADADADIDEDEPDEADAEEDSEDGEDEDGRMSIRWATSDVGSYGYTVASGLVDFLNQDLSGDYVVTVQPYSTGTDGTHAVREEEAEITFTADLGMRGLYEREGPFEGVDEDLDDLVHTFYAYPMETFLVVDEDNVDDYDSWADFDGAEVFFTTAGFQNFLNLQRVFETLDYEFNHVEIDTGAVADSLGTGSIEAAGAYTTSEVSLPAWWVEAETQTDIAAVNMSDDEVAQLEDAGIVTTTIDPADAFTQDVGVDEIMAVPFTTGYNASLSSLDEDVVQEMLEIFYEQKDRIADLDPGFGPLAEDFVGLQTFGIEANPDIPVHPGTAAFLEEHDAWDDDWTIAE